MTKSAKAIIKEKDLETCTKVERDVFMCDMRTKEALLIVLPKSEYNQVKLLATSHLIWKALENSFEGYEHSKKFWKIVLKVMNILRN